MSRARMIANLDGWRQVNVPSGARGMKLAFLCLLGFIATQGFLIPVAALPVNWVAWPTLPDLFAIGLTGGVMLAARRVPLLHFDRTLLKYLNYILGFFVLNLVAVTMSTTQTGEGVKFGAYSIFLLFKYIVVFWAASHIPITRKRQLGIHTAALIAFTWICMTMLAGHYQLIDLKTFLRHLPIESGIWSAPSIVSTVSSRPGQVTVVLLILAGLIVCTAKHRFAWLAYVYILPVGVTTIFLSGSRQGLVRVLVFLLALCVTEIRKITAIVVLMLVGGVFLATVAEDVPLLSSPGMDSVVKRQRVLVEDPFSNEGLSGRPDIWSSVIETLNEDPIRYIVGTGIGNYVEFRNAAHNMVLQTLQDGGIIGLVILAFCWTAIFKALWQVRNRAWPMVAVAAGMLSSLMTSSILYPNLSTGWYLGLFFVCLHISVCYRGEEMDVGGQRLRRAIPRRHRAKVLTDLDDSVGMVEHPESGPEKA